MSVELVFMTTNRAKLAHLKYLGRKQFVEIHGFRERTYYGSYSEPRINDRQDLLSRSYSSALHQWTRSKQSLDSIFFLEDTSIKIEALSSTTEVPGVDVKFWMRQMNFQKLNQLLSENGGNRTVSVRSDIVAHIPESIRKARGITERFIWVHGISKGTIVEKEEKFSGNLVHPWLDDKTFNKWFVPSGCEKPISMLTIDIADGHDFRARAFENLLAQLKRLNISFRRDSELPLEQYNLPGFEPNPPVIVICGYSCAGKTTVANWLSKNHGFLHIEASDYMYRAFRERHGVVSNIRIGDFAEAALIEEPSIAARPIADLIKHSGHSPVVVTGFRSPAEIIELRNRLRGNTSVLVTFLEADFQTRLQRAIARQREPVDSEKLLRRDTQEDRMGLSSIREYSSETHVPNMTRKSDLSRRFKKIYDEKFAIIAKRSNAPAIRGFGPLESLILQAMLGTSSSDTDWTTTEIAKLIGERFGIAKEKDNVSRYFTQEYRPYYDVQVVHSKSRYKLSTTGESIAKILMENSLSM